MSLRLCKGTEILQSIIFVNCEMSLFLCEEHKSHKTYFAITARFLSVYVKKTNLAVNHFSLTANFFLVYIKEYESLT